MGNRVNKFIDEYEDNICPISQELISLNNNYMKCNFCNKNFLETVLIEWLQSRHNYNRTCPTCRRLWSDYNVYINSN